MKFLKYILLAFFCFNTFSNYNLRIEPYLGFALSGDYQQLKTGQNNVGSVKGYDIGARFSIGFDNFILGFDIENGSYMVERKSSAKVDTSLNSRHLGVFVGYNFFENIRFIATYIFDSYIHLENDQAYDNAHSDTQFKLGLGYLFKGKVWASVEYKEIEVYNILNYQTKMNYETLGLSHSIPFELY